MRALHGDDAFERQVIALRQRGAPARLDHGGGVPFCDDRRSDNTVAGPQALALVHRSIVPVTLGKQAIHLERDELPCARPKHRDDFLGRGRRADRLDRYRLDDERFVGHQKPVLSAIALLEVGDQCSNRPAFGPNGRRVVRNLQRRIGTFVLQVQAALDADALRCDPLRFDFALRCSSKLAEHGFGGS